MDILIIGSGGREHAIGWKVKQSLKTGRLFFAPGNAGTIQLGVNLSIAVSDFLRIKQAVLDNQIDMVIVGPEVPLVEGIADFFAADPELSAVKMIGPKKSGAMLEGSKDFSKDFMKRHQIPTARYLSITSENKKEGLTFLSTLKPPYVLKADGLAAGKGVLIIPNLAEAQESLLEMLSGKFGTASKKVVIEEYLSGIEVSVFIVTDGKNYKILPEAKDYKRIGEGDSGPNTGGMGAVSPVPFAGPEFMGKVEKRIIIPTVKGIQDDGLDYKGFLFFGLMNCEGEPYVIEYNARLGDPETEAIMLRLKSDLVELLEGVASQSLDEKIIEIDDHAAVTVMLVSGGYPDAYEKGKIITGFGDVDGSIVFHAGTKSAGDAVITDGGRVLSVSSLGSSFRQALNISYSNASKLNFEKMYFRKDIGFDL
jgi:phosphoribosylamine---glycine ligase